jgi:hypothetical protein
VFQLFDIELFNFKDEESQWKAYTLNTTTYSLGIFLAAIRISEPYVLKNFKQDS